MGREIRRVPIGWEHPKSRQQTMVGGRLDFADAYTPLYDGSFEAEAKEWLEKCQEWVDGKADDFAEDSWARGYHAKKFAETGNEWHLPENFLAQTYARFCEHHGNFPQPDDYRPDWPEEDMTAFQIYETVSEGTPVSPVFITHSEMKRWLILQGYSEEVAEKFIEQEWVPSMTMMTMADGTVDIRSNFDTLEGP